MAIRQKLYYNIDNLGLTGSPASPRVIKFVAGTGTDFGSAAGIVGLFGVNKDRYDNVMSRNAFSGVTGAAAKTRQAIKAIWQLASAQTAGDFTTSGFAPGICLDFIAPTADVNIAAAPTIDPASVARPWLRLRHGFNNFLTAGLSIKGVIYIERQHSIEV